MKKVLSLILAMVLVVGLIPAAFASDAPPAEGYEYVFKNDAHTGSDGNTGSVSFSTATQSIETTNKMKLISELSTASTVLLIADEGKYDFLQQKEFLRDLKPEYPDNEAVVEGRFLLENTPISEGDLEDILQGTAISIRNLPDKFTEKKDEANYSNSFKVLKNIIEGKVTVS